MVTVSSLLVANFSRLICVLVRLLLKQIIGQVDCLLDVIRRGDDERVSAAGR